MADAPASAAPLPPQEWFKITAADEGTYDVFRQIGAVGTAYLYSIDAADKARSVPVINIWRVGDTQYSRKNVLMQPPISAQFVAAPKFGVTAQFAERPPASINSVTVKKHNPGGWILFREVDISITVHKPEVLAAASTEANVLSALLQPGNIFYLEYGWAGGRNALLGDGDSRKELEPELNPDEKNELEAWRKNPSGKKEPEWWGSRIPAVQGVRFTVTNYNFSIQPDGQYSFQIHGIEDGELQVREMTIFDQPDFPDLSKGKPEEAVQKIAGYFNNKLATAASFSNTGANSTAGTKTVASTVPMITLKNVLDVLFAKPIVNAISGLGYGHVHLSTGVFNSFAPKTVTAYGGKELKDTPIGDFEIPLRDVQKLIDKLTSENQQITVQNMLREILGLVSDHGNFDIQKEEKPSMWPELQLFTIYNHRAGYAKFQIVDRKRYLTIIGFNEHLMAQNKKVDFKLLEKHHIPYWTLFHRNSFFKDAKFDVTNNEQMKSIFIKAQVPSTRDEIKDGKTGAVQAAGGMPMGLLMYRSAIKGSVTTIGNFAFDLLGSVWMSFGVPILDGLFYIIGKTDTVTKDGFYSELTLQAEGSNPMGTKPAAPATMTEKIQVEQSSGQQLDVLKHFVVVDPEPAAAPTNYVEKK